jgi:hypothetical protein
MHNLRYGQEAAKELKHKHLQTTQATFSRKSRSRSKKRRRRHLKDLTGTCRRLRAFFRQARDGKVCLKPQDQVMVVWVASAKVH